MKQAASACRVLMWVVLAISLIFHGLVLIALLINNNRAAELGQTGAAFSPTLMILGMALLVVGAVLTAACRRYPWIGVALLVVAGVLLAFNTVKLAEQFPVSITSTGEEAGLTTAKLLLRHWSAELIPLFAIAAWLLEALPQWRHVPLAVLLPESESEEAGEHPVGSVFLQCSRCNAKFFNSAGEAVFTCPYCRKRLGMPGKNWEGLKKKRSLKAKARKAAANGDTAGTEPPAEA